MASVGLKMGEPVQNWSQEAARRVGNEEPVAAQLRPLAQITRSSTQRDNQYDTG